MLSPVRTRRGQSHQQKQAKVMTGPGLSYETVFFPWWSLTLIPAETAPRSPSPCMVTHEGCNSSMVFKLRTAPCEEACSCARQWQAWPTSNRHSPQAASMAHQQQARPGGSRHDLPAAVMAHQQQAWPDGGSHGPPAAGTACRLCCLGTVAWDMAVSPWKPLTGLSPALCPALLVSLMAC